MQNKSIIMLFEQQPGDFEQQKQLVNNMTIIRDRLPHITFVATKPFDLEGFTIYQHKPSPDQFIIYPDRFIWPDQIEDYGNTFCYKPNETDEVSQLYFKQEKKLIEAPQGASEGLALYHKHTQYEGEDVTLLFEKPKNLFIEYIEAPYTNKALFLDRDGILIKDTHYPHKIEDLEIIPQCIDLIQKAKARGYHIILLSNQAGVAKGKFSLEEMKEFHYELVNRLKAQFQIELDDVYYCPHHVDGTVEKFTQESFSRKPQPGMLIKACQKNKVNLNLSIMVGDKPSDNFFIKDMKFYLLKSEYCPMHHPNMVYALAQVDQGLS